VHNVNLLLYAASIWKLEKKPQKLRTNLVVVSSTKICFLTSMAWVWWALLKLAPNCSLQAPKTLASPHRNTVPLKSRPRLPVPNFAVWTNKKLAPNCSHQAPKTLPSPHRNTIPLKDGRGLRPAAACANNKLAPNCSRQAAKTLPSSHRNTMPLKDGRGLRRADACAQHSLLHRQDTSSKLQPSRLRHAQTACYWRTRRATFQSTNFPHSTQCCSGLRHHTEGNDLLYSVIHAACCT